MAVPRVTRERSPASKTIPIAHLGRKSRKLLRILRLIVRPDAPSAAMQDRGKIKVSVNLVNVLVSVLDEHNRPAPDLPVEAFHILDEDSPQVIAVFEKETAAAAGSGADD